jgi:hypothetical protein
MMNQRWNNGRGAWRPADELIDPSGYDVAEIPGDDEAKAFVTQHHYSGSYPAARFRFGLYDPKLVGVAVFSVPCSTRVLTKVFPCDPKAAVELGRLVLLDCVGGNGESWFIARCFEQLRKKGLAGVVSFSDPAPRRRLDGKVVMPGHVGTVYKATNGVYLGRGDARTLRLLDDGRIFSHRAEQKIRKQESGWRYAVKQLVAAGAAPLGNEDPALWLKRELGRFRRLRHRGNHKYAWGLNRAMRNQLPSSLPYPKQIDEVA